MNVSGEEDVLGKPPARETSGGPQAWNGLAKSQPGNASSFLSGALDSIRQLEKEQDDRQEAAKRQIQTLSDEIAGLRQEAARVNDLQAEIERLRHDLEQCKLHHGGFVPAEPVVDSTTENPSSHVKFDQRASRQMPKEAETMPRSAYQALYTKCEAQRKQIEILKQQGSEYKKAYLRFKTEYNKLKIRREKDKATVQSWQAYSDRLTKKRTDARRAHELVGRFLQDGEESPSLTITSPLRYLTESSWSTSKSGSTPTIGDEISGRVSVSKRDIDGLQLEAGAAKDFPEGLHPALPIPSGRTDRDGRTQVCPQAHRLSQEGGRLPRIDKPNSDEVSIDASSAISNQASKTHSTSSAPQLVRDSQTTEDEDQIAESDDNEIPEVAPHRSSDPVVISSRNLKRKRSKDMDNARKNGKIVIVKDEPSSSPLNYTGIADLFHGESMDLNDFSRDVITPRKNRHLADALLGFDFQAIPLGSGVDATQDRASSTPLELNGSDPNKEPLMKPNANFQTEEPNLRFVKSESPRTMQSATETHLVKQLERRRTKNRSNEDRGVLQPLSANRRILPRTSNTTAKRNNGDRAFHGRIAEFAEDGENYEDQSITNAPREQNYPNVVGRRINDLLETASPNKQLLTPNATVGQQCRRSRNSARATRDSDNLRRALHTPVQATEKAIKDLDQIRPDEEPLRARPVTRLRADDFKINPASNQGYDYAFAEVVRNHEQRRCLPGCTRPECCGDRFRKMVELGGVAAPSPRLWDSSQTDADQRLLEEYMGGEASRLNAMGAHEKEEMLLKARAEQLARSYGKHRQAFQRPKTPPGYWRTDFPTTQEVEADKEQSRVLEREKVEERYREAMRPDGRWVFRDE